MPDDLIAVRQFRKLASGKWKPSVHCLKLVRITKSRVHVASARYLLTFHLDTGRWVANDSHRRAFIVKDDLAKLQQTVANRRKEQPA